MVFSRCHPNGRLGFMEPCFVPSAHTAVVPSPITPTAVSPESTTASLHNTSSPDHNAAARTSKSMPSPTDSDQPRSPTSSSEPSPSDISSTVKSESNSNSSMSLQPPSPLSLPLPSTETSRGVDSLPVSTLPVLSTGSLSSASSAAASSAVYSPTPTPALSDSKSRVRLSTGTSACIGVGTVAIFVALAISWLVLRVRWRHRARSERTGSSTGASDGPASCPPPVQPPNAATDQWYPPDSFIASSPPFCRVDTTGDGAALFDEKPVQEQENGSRSPFLRMGAGTDDQADITFEEDVGDGDRNGVNNCRLGDALQERDGGVRLAGGWPGEVTTDEFRDNEDSSGSCESGGSGYTLPPPYSPHLEEISM